MRYGVLPDVNCQLRGFDENVDVFSHGELTLHPMEIGVTLSLYEWKELKKTILYLKTESQN
jgi:hypothetical protein